MLKRRYEILLPLMHNDGRPVGDDKLNQTRMELVERFDGVSFQPHPVQGIWRYEDEEYEDVSVQLTVDVADTPENREFFIELKAKLLERFEQIEIYIVSFPIDIL